jgi:hypothetical protein
VDASPRSVLRCRAQPENAQWIRSVAGAVKKLLLRMFKKQLLAFRGDVSRRRCGSADDDSAAGVNKMEIYI